MWLFDRQQRRFLVIDEAQFILVEPDTTKLGWGVVKFVARLQVTGLSPHVILAVHSVLVYCHSYYYITTTLFQFTNRKYSAFVLLATSKLFTVETQYISLFRNATYQTKVDNYQFILNFDAQSLEVVNGYRLESRQTKSTGFIVHFSVYGMQVVSFETRSTSIAFLTTKLLLLV